MCVCIKNKERNIYVYRIHINIQNMCQNYREKRAVKDNLTPFLKGCVAQYNQTFFNFNFHD